MCGIWGGDCDISESCNVFGHDFIDGDCIYCAEQTEAAAITVL